MICVESEQKFRWVRSDGGHDHGAMIYAGGKVVTYWGPIKFEELRPQDLVQIQPACNGRPVFVEAGRLIEMPMRTD